MSVSESVANLQAEMQKLKDEVANSTDTMSSADSCIKRLGALVVTNANDPAAITAIGLEMQGLESGLHTSATTLAQDILANTPAAPPPPAA